MVTPTKGARLGNSAAHERLILANLCCSLFEHGKIKTTQMRAKRMQPLAEKLITIAKKQTLASHRQIVAMIRNKSVAHILVTELAEQFKEREGGYTRIIKIERRKGDQAEMAIIELVSEPVVKTPSAKKAAAKAEAEKAAKAAEKAVASDAAKAAEEVVEEAPTEEVTADSGDSADSGVAESSAEESSAEETPAAEEKPAA